MSLERERTLKETQNNSPGDFASEISRKDEMKLLKKKMAMLKDAIFEQRRRKAELTEEMTAIQQKLKRYEAENRKKQQKNEALMAEIKSLKDALIVERNQKQKCLEQLQSKLGSESGKEDANKNKMVSSRFFGLRQLFQK